MKVLLISANRAQINMPAFPLGLSHTALAAESSGHEVRLLDLSIAPDYESEIRNAIAEFNPVVIGISIRNIDDQNMLRPEFLLDHARQAVEICRSSSPSKIVLGGAGYSIFPQAALEYCRADLGIQGEGEYAFPLLLSILEQGGDIGAVPGLFLPGTCARKQRTFIDDLETLPCADYSLWASLKNKDKLWLPIQSRRGCPMNCSYCSTSAIEGLDIRKRAPQSVTREMFQAVEVGFRNFYFIDNEFNMPRSYAMELCRAMVQSGVRVRWRCIIYPLNVDRELAEMMTRTGCVEASLSFESGDERILKNMNKRFTPEDVESVCKVVGSQGIRRMGFLMLGSPGETRETAQRSLSFADSLKLDMLKITIGVRIYPNTALAELSVREGVISPEDNLLLPRFYITSGLEDWLRETVTAWLKDRPNWVF